MTTENTTEKTVLTTDKKDFYYDLPEELIAQTPVYPRDSSRMLVYERKNLSLIHISEPTRP